MGVVKVCSSMAPIALLAGILGKIHKTRNVCGY